MLQEKLFSKLANHKIRGRRGQTESQKKLLDKLGCSKAAVDVDEVSDEEPSV